jgi:ATP-dependent Clp protease ATP-binding subunit ClpB
MENEFAVGKEKWEKEVQSMRKVTELKNQLDRYKFELEQAERTQDYETASKLMYSIIPEMQIKLEENSHNCVLSSQNVASVISRQTEIPIEKIMKSKQENILEIESYLKSRVHGQDKPLNEIADTLITSHAGLKDETKPLGSFLLRGPSGVGKTETAKALSHFLFDTEAGLVRFDMSEFSEKHSVSKLIGAPAGYVGYEEGGSLTEAIRRRPYSVILFDEIEKAHRDFSDILLQILDDGRLTDNKGKTINFKNTILLLTTNSKDVEFDFKPEVLGRLDAILDYQELDPSIMQSLIDKQVKLLNERLQSKNLKVKLDEITRKMLALRGYDNRFGARPLANIFNKLITKPLSKELLAGNLGSGTLKTKWFDNGAESTVLFTH